MPTRSKAKGRSEFPGGYGALPRVLWQHPAYCNLSGSAVKLLMDLVCQYKGKNNGDLTNSYSVLKRRGWRSKTTIKKATKELLDAGLILITREGRFMNPGGICTLFALSWKPIDECPGKNLSVKKWTP